MQSALIVDRLRFRGPQETNVASIASTISVMLDGRACSIIFRMRIAFLSGFLFFVVSAASLVGASTLLVHVVDENGSPVPARIYLTNETGDAFFPDGVIIYKKLNWDVAEQHFIPPGGVFSVELPEGTYSLRVERGKEYLPFQENISVPSSGKVQKTISLQRWVSMAGMGWFSADMHAHVRLQDVPTLMQGEDLNVLLPITMWRVSFVPPYKDPHLQDVLAKADSSGAVHVAKDRWFTPVNEELESDQSSILLSHLGRRPVELSFPFEQIAERAHEQGALTDSEKATSVELPAMAALGGINFVGLANNHFWRSDCYTGPWGVWPDHAKKNYPLTCEGFAQAGFEIYYALLNLGLPIKLSAGSAYGVQPTPLGWSRIYVHTATDSSPESWFKALQTGHSFVTTGPMILLKVNGLEPGEEQRGARFPLQADVELTVLSSIPANNAEIIVNGRPHTLSLTAEASNKFSFQGRTTLTLDSSSWIAARYLAPHAATIDLAHTSPIYFWNQTSPLPSSRADAEYLLGRVDSLIREAKAGRSENGSDSTSNVFDNPEIRHLTLQYLEQAKKSLELKLAQ